MYLGDANEIVKQIEGINAICTDPPYGVKNRCNYGRFSGGNPQFKGLWSNPNNYPPVIGDDGPFDPTPWLKYKKVVLFGSQYYGAKLPVGTTLVWVKKSPKQLGTFLSDAEIAWMKGGVGVYVFQHMWNGAARASEHGKYWHPTQKPVALMEWVLGRMKLKPDDLVFDPYAGTAPIGEACMKMGFRYVGCEIDPTYYQRAVDRLTSCV